MNAPRATGTGIHFIHGLAKKPINGTAVVDVRASNWGSWRHSITHYLSGTRFRAHLNDALQGAAR